MSYLLQQGLLHDGNFILLLLLLTSLKRLNISQIARTQAIKILKGKTCTFNGSLSVLGSYDFNTVEQLASSLLHIAPNENPGPFSIVALHEVYFNSQDMM